MQKIIFKLNIRKFKNEDFEQVFNLHKKAMEIINTYKGDGSWNNLKDIKNHYNNNFGMFFSWGNSKQNCNNGRF